MKLYSSFRAMGLGLSMLLNLGGLAVGYPGSMEAFDYWVQDDGVVITEGNQAFSGALVIPDAIEGLPVVKIDDYAFNNHDGITSLVLPDSLRSIDYRAFYKCDGFTNVDIPDGVESIGKEAFWQCNYVTTVSLPGSLTSIGEFAFGNCGRLAAFYVDPSNSAYTDIDGVLFSKDGRALIDYPKKWMNSRVYVIPDGTISVNDKAFNGVWNLRNLTLPESLEFIGESAFVSCGNWTNAVLPASLQSIGPLAFSGCKNLPEIFIPSNTIYIGTGAFDNCSKLQLINVASENSAYMSLDGILYNEDLTRLICCPAGWEGEMSVPDGVQHIGYRAFYKCLDVGQIILADSVETIGDEAFRNIYNSSNSDTSSFLTNITFSAGVTALGKQMFLGCNSLQTIKVDSANALYSDIDGVLFNKDGTVLLAYPPGRIGAYIVPDGVEKIHEYAFSDCDQLTSLTIPESMIYLSREAIKDCANLTSVTFSGNLDNLGSSVFELCYSLTNLTVTSDGENFSSDNGILFSADGKRLVRYPSGRSGKYAVPEGTESIEWRAFYKCENLSGVSLPTTLNTIGRDAFLNSKNLRSSIFYGDAPALAYTAFNGADGLFAVYYLESSAGFSTPEWHGYSSDQLRRPVLSWSEGGLIDWYGQSGLDYQVESSTNLVAGEWISTNELVVGVGTTNSVQSEFIQDSAVFRVNIDLP